MQTEEITEEEVKPKKRGPKRKHPEKEAEEINVNGKYKMLGFETRKALQNAMNQELRELCALPQMRHGRYYVKEHELHTSIHSVSDVYTIAVFYFASPTRGNHIIKYDPIFLREAMRHGGDTVKAFIEAYQ